MPNKLILLFSTVFLLSACAGSPKAYRINCDEEVDAAWNELSIAKAEGFDGTVSYAKALTLITTARTQKVSP